MLMSSKAGTDTITRRHSTINLQYELGHLEKVLDFRHDEIGVTTISLVSIYPSDGSIAKNMLSHTAAMAKFATIPFIEGKSIRS
jgi:hypothetical protein